MRPEILFPLAAPLTSLSGVGGKFASLVANLINSPSSPSTSKHATIADLLWHLPTGIIDRSQRPNINQLKPGMRVTLELTIAEHQPAYRRSKKPSPYRVKAFNDSGDIILTFFHARDDYMSKILPLGQKRFVSGVVEFYRNQAQITHPEHILTAAEFAEMPVIEPVYPLSAGIQLRRLGKIMREALKKIPELQEWDPEICKRHHWPSWADAMQLVHNPKTLDELNPESPARLRLAYDELLANQLALALIRHWMRSMPSRSFRKSTTLRQKALAAFSFSLTQAQKSALVDIDIDMAAPQPMLRLLQGDVGSGKTIVGFLAMLNAIEAGAQAALMAPTEILSRQHGKNLLPLCEAAGLKLTVLTSHVSKAQRSVLLEQIASGHCDVIVGTHSLFQKDLLFDNLGLIVIDEQHRFGVHQRLQLSSKSKQGADVLVMTATPIPRTLTLTAYGDMDVSLIKEKPQGRKPIATRVLPLSRMDEIILALQKALHNKQKIYWVCPLIEKSRTQNTDAEKDETAPMTATERYQYLSEHFNVPIGLIHGKMASDERDRILEQFQHGEINLLVSTIVIEVGVDISDATIMVIEHAERFGLAQLHQLRGRVGRSDKPSSCLLVYREPLNPIAFKRLAALRKSNDGFYIADEDLRLRGSGELLGTKQSGAPEFKLASLTHHKDLLTLAHQRANAIVESNPSLQGAQGQSLKTLLYLFRREDMVDYPRSG